MVGGEPPLPLDSDSPLVYKSYLDVYGIIRNKIKSHSKAASRYIYFKLNLDYEHVIQEDQVFQTRFVTLIEIMLSKVKNNERSDLVQLIQLGIHFTLLV